MPLLRNPAPQVAAFAVPLETILSTIERENPARLTDKSKEFRRDAAGILNLRAELNVGWMLANSKCPFDFGGEGQADYECLLAAGTAWVEVTTKSQDDLSRLYDELEGALRGHSVVAELQGPRKLVVPKAQRQLACSRVFGTCQAI